MRSPEWLDELEAGIDEANTAKSSPTSARIVAVGLDLVDRSTVFSLEQIAQPGDVIISDFSAFANDLRDLAIQLCGGTVSVNKLFDVDGDGDRSTGTLDREAGASFTATVDGGDIAG